MADIDTNEDYGVGFLYKAMRERDPKKRKVKPVDKHLLQLDFGGLEDSSDDSDYEVADYQDDNSEPDSEADDSSETSESSECSASDDNQNEENQESGNEGMTVEDLLANLKTKSPKEEELNFSSAPSSVKLRLRICSVCLGDYSEEDDEIVECDCCGITVHEGCYGVSENQSVGSTVSSASTEPWFCDACKAGVKPHCELCPNFGGIYKETDAGKWVHVVCALYIPGVAFGDVDLLSPVTLLEMPYSKWGARECDLCEDARFSRTGVAIGCDAGMCRNYFHVTCAQREGLLSEASPDEDIADPFYAYCKQHAEKNGARMKRRNFLAVQSNCKKPEEKSNGDDMDYKEKARVERKLNGHRQKYLVARTNRAPTWVPSEKLPRLLTTSPSAMRRLLRKAELLGISTQMSSTQKSDIRKKWHVAPAFSVDFISYYLDRNVRTKNAKVHLKDHLQLKGKLDKQERVLRSKYDRLSSEVEKQKKQNTILRSEAEKLWELLGKINGKPFLTPKVLRPKRSPKKKKDTPKSPPAVIHSCGICNRSHNQHLLAHCDTCKKYYHLGCVDPPLTRMPKKTKLMGWQCSECDSSESDDSDANEGVDTNAPRKLRESHQIKLPAKFTPPPKETKKEADVAKDRKGKRKRKKSKKLLQAEGEEEEKEMDFELYWQPVLKKEKPIKVREPKLTKPRDVRTQCCVCLQSGDNSNLVRCDECLLCYHFGCLDPPLKKSPKQRGYAWHCTACDPTESDEVDEDDDDDHDDYGVDEAETIDIEEDEEPLEPPKLEKVAEDGERSKDDKKALSTGTTPAITNPKKIQPTTNKSTSTTPESAMVSPTSSKSSRSPSAATCATAHTEMPLVSPKKKTITKDKAQEKGSAATSGTPPHKTKNLSHDATVYHVSQDAVNCTPLAAIKPIASSTPDLCYVGTEDIIPKNGVKPIRTKKKSCSKKENKSTLKHKRENSDLEVPVNKQGKAAAKKLTNKAENVNGPVNTELENTSSEAEPVKKKKRTKKAKPSEAVENGDHENAVKVETNESKKMKKPPETVKKEPAVIDISNDKCEKTKPSVTKKKRKTSSECTDSKIAANPIAKKKRKTDKKNGVQDKGATTKKKKGQKKSEPLDSSIDLNSSVENKDEDSLDISSMLVNKKPTAEALALQATVEKLQGRLTPTLHQTNNTNNGNSNGRNIETLETILPKLVSSRPEKLQSSDQSNLPRSNNEVIMNENSSHCKNKEPSNTPSPSVPLNLSNLKEKPNPNIICTENSNTMTNKTISLQSLDSRSAVLDLSNKEDKSAVSKDGPVDLSRKDQTVKWLKNKDKSVHRTPNKTELQVQPIAHVNNLDKTNYKVVNKDDSVVPKCVDSQSKHVMGPQKEGDNFKAQSHSKAVKKERVESAIERLFQKRDTNSGSSGVKKQRVEKAIDMLLAKKEKGVDQTDKEQSVTENLHQKTVTDSDCGKDNRS